jgi:hypothetical protein
MSPRHIRTATIHTLAALLLAGAISVAQTAPPSSVPRIWALHNRSVSVSVVSSRK